MRLFADPALVLIIHVSFGTRRAQSDHHMRSTTELKLELLNEPSDDHKCRSEKLVDICVVLPSHLVYWRCFCNCCAKTLHGSDIGTDDDVNILII